MVLLGISNPKVLAQVSDYEPSEERSNFNNRKISIMDGNSYELPIIIMAMQDAEIGALNELLFEFPEIDRITCIS